VSARAAPGFALAETLVAATIAGLLSTLLLGAMAVQVRLARLAAERASAAETIRTAAHVVSGEVARLTSRDVRAIASDSLATRVFRGTGTVCGSKGDGVRIRFRGDRQPDPRKDSVVVIDATGAESALGLVGARLAPTEACASSGGETVQVWTLSEPVQDAAVVLLFESGSFYISASALRYRLGSEGRQPLTAELLRAPSGFEVLRDGMLRYTLATEGRAVRIAAPLADGNGS
jgi:type II secretory pathway pseudopilin PulG